MWAYAHPADRDLAIERIAAAHGVSVRHRYDVWSRFGRDAPPAQELVDRRLERTREQLAVADPAWTSIATIARRWGSGTPATSAVAPARRSAAHRGSGR